MTCLPYADIVEAQHRLIADGPELRLVLGTSMGWMQTWMWRERYPEKRVDGRGRNLLWRRLLIKIIQLGEEEPCGASGQQPPSLGLAWNLLELMAGSPARLTTAFAGPGEADNYIQNIAEKVLKVEKVDDVIWEFDASRDW